MAKRFQNVPLSCNRNQKDEKEETDASAERFLLAYICKKKVGPYSASQFLNAEPFNSIPNAVAFGNALWSGL